MKHRISFVVVGYEPAINDKTNKFLAALDLGISGAYIPFCMNATLTIIGELKPQEHYMEILKKAFEDSGYIDINVSGITKTEEIKDV